MAQPTHISRSISIVLATLALALCASLLISVGDVGPLGDGGSLDDAGPLDDGVALNDGSGRPIIELLRRPGAFLFDSFHLAAFFVPAFLFASAYLLLYSGPISRFLVLQNALIPTFLSASLFLRLALGANADRSPITQWFLREFSQLGASVIAFLLTAACAAGGALLYRRMYQAASEAREPDAEQSADAPERETGATRVAPIAFARPLDPGSKPFADARKHRSNGASEPAAGLTAARTEARLVTEDLSYEELTERKWFEHVPEPEAIGVLRSTRGRTQPGDEPVYVLDGGTFRERWPGVDVEDAELVPDFDVEELEAAELHAEKLRAEEVDRDELEREQWRREELAAGEQPEEALGEDGPLAEAHGEQASAADSGKAPPHADNGRGRETGNRSDRPARRNARRGRYEVPVEGLLDSYGNQSYWEIDEETREAAEILRVTLEEFQIQAEVTGIRKGPVITMFEILPAPGVKLAKIVNLSDNIALRLAASSVRIVAPIPGKHAVGIEIPNKRRNIVSFGELLQEDDFSDSKIEIPLALGKDIPGDAQIVDLARMPHLLIAGATGSGKSVCVNSIICSILYRSHPEEVKMILIDPKIVELKFYNDIPHLLTPVITDPKRAFQALQWAVYEMERRYSLLDSIGVRDVRSYNNRVTQRKLATETLPYIVVVVDEFADLMASTGKELESTLARLAAMSRAVGIHLVLATQRPSTDVITGLIKANIPSRIAFMVASKVDSRIILDTMGAEKLLGRGDMLFTSAWDPFPTRIQGAFLSEDEVERVVEHVKTLGEPDYIDDEIFVEDDEDDDYYQGELEDPLMEKAIELVVTANKASASYLQRRLKVGYNRAARLVEEMERLGIVGPQQGSKPRDVIGTAAQ